MKTRPFHLNELMRWDRRYIELAKYVSRWSRDPKCRVGAVITGRDKRRLCIGVNGVAPGMPDQTIMRRGDKNQFILHAERNALDNAHFDVEGGTLYTTKALCCQCASSVMSRGISRVFMPDIPDYGKWADNQSSAYDMLTRYSDVVINFYWEEDLNDERCANPDRVV